MPLALKPGKSRAVIAHNIRILKRDGFPFRQAEAIALHHAGVPRRHRGKYRRRRPPKMKRDGRGRFTRPAP